jgi:mannose-6-phosphate isomerase-like protein (cupin superfamily)
MPLETRKNFFATRDDVLRDMIAQNLWPATALSPPSDGLPVHSHAATLHVYVMEGETEIFDEETGQNFAVGPGDKLVIRKGVRHAEGVVKDRMVYILGLEQAMSLDEAIGLVDPITRA